MKQFSRWPTLKCMQWSWISWMVTINWFPECMPWSVICWMVLINWSKTVTYYKPHFSSTVNIPWCCITQISWLASLPLISIIGHYLKNCFPHLQYLTHCAMFERRQQSIGFLLLACSSSPSESILCKAFPPWPSMWRRHLSRNVFDEVMFLLMQQFYQIKMLVLMISPI